MVRVIQFRDCEETTTFVLYDYNEEIIDAIKRVKKITLDYPWKIYFDFEVANVVKNVDYIENLEDWCNYFEYYGLDEDQKAEISPYIQKIKDYYKYK
jgi:uncharacterized protein YpiB (UPF0302 family)